MLEAIRKHVGSFVVKILFVVLVLSFVVWGVADVVSPRGGTDWAAEVGDVRISTEAYEEEYRETLNRLGGAFGSRLDAEQARALGLPGSVLNRMIDAALLEQAATDLGIVVPDTVIREQITSDPRFRNQLGQFDAALFRSILQQNGFTEERYVDLLRREMRRDQLVESVISGVAPPRSLVEAMQRYRGERRVAEVVRVPEAAPASVAATDEATLRQFHQDYPGLFTAPETRAVTAVVLTADDLAEGQAVTEDELQTAYQDRLAEFTVPERRSFRQAVFASEEAARQARERVAKGADLAAAAAGAGGQGDAAPIGPVTREQLPAELAAGVFAQPQGTVSEPIQSPLGWHLVQVTAIEPGSVQTFEQARPQLLKELKRERAGDALIELGNRLEDTLGRGASLEEAAAELGLGLRTLPAIDARGRDDAGAPVADLPERFVETAFATPANAESPLVEADRDTYFVLRVDQVRPSAVRPFESIRPQVEQAWRARQLNDRAKAAAEALAERVRGGAALAAVAGERGLKAETTPPFDRGGEGASGLPPALVAAVFAAKPGEVVVVPTPDGYAVARLSSVLPPAEAAGGGALGAELAEAMRADILGQFAAALRARYPVNINPRAIEQI